MPEIYTCKLSRHTANRASKEDYALLRLYLPLNACEGSSTSSRTHCSPARIHRMSPSAVSICQLNVRLLRICPQRVFAMISDIMTSTRKTFMASRVFRSSMNCPCAYPHFVGTECDIQGSRTGTSGSRLFYFGSVQLRISTYLPSCHPIQTGDHLTKGLVLSPSRALFNIMVSVSPRMRDSLDYEEPDTIDPRMEWGFRSLTLSSSGYEDHDEHIDDHRAFSASPDHSSARRKKRQAQQQTDFDHVQDHEYQTTAYGDAFRLAVLKPGAGTQAIEIELIWGSVKAPQRRDYKCLSYCWQTTVQDAAILVDGRRFEVTGNLLSALRSIRKRREKVLIWIDQICINQRDFVERGHQVSIMKHIYSRARQVVVCVIDDVCLNAS